MTTPQSNLQQVQQVQTAAHHSTAARRIAERLWDAEARIGKIIYLPAAHDGESACEDLEGFIENEIHEDYVAREFERVWPEFGQLQNDNDDDDDDRWFRVAKALDMFQSHCPLPYLVLIEYTIKTSLRDVKKDHEYPYGTWRSGWGYSRQIWTLAHTVEQAVERAIELAEAQKREAWDTAGAAKAKGKAAKKEKARG